MNKILVTTLLFVFASACKASSVDELGLDLSSLTGNRAVITKSEPSSAKTDNKLSNYAYQVGFDVSNMTQQQRDAVAGSYDQMPSAIFCEEHGEFEVQLSGNSIWERTKLMKLQKAIGPISTTH